MLQPKSKWRYVNLNYFLVASPGIEPGSKV